MVGSVSVSYREPKSRTTPSVETEENVSIDPTRTPFDRVVIFVSGVSSASNGRLGGNPSGRVGPIFRDAGMEYG